MIPDQTVRQSVAYETYPIDKLNNTDDDYRGYYYPTTDAVELVVDDPQFQQFVANATTSIEYLIQDTEQVLGRTLRHELAHVSLSKKTSFWDQLFLHNATIAFDLKKTFLAESFHDMTANGYESLDPIVVNSGRVHRRNKMEFVAWEPIQETYATLFQSVTEEGTNATHALQCAQGQMAARVADRAGGDSTSFSVEALLNSTPSAREALVSQYVYEALGYCREIVNGFGDDHEGEALKTVEWLARLASNPGVDIEGWIRQGTKQFLDALRTLAENASSLAVGDDTPRTLTPDEIASHVTELSGYEPETPADEQSYRRAYLESAIEASAGYQIGKREELSTRVRRGFREAIEDERMSSLIIRNAETAEVEKYYLDRPVLLVNHLYTTCMLILFRSIHTGENLFEDEAYTATVREDLEDYGSAELVERMSEYVEFLRETGRIDEVSEDIHTDVYSAVP